MNTKHCWSGRRRAAEPRGMNLRLPPAERPVRVLDERAPGQRQCQ